MTSIKKYQDLLVWQKGIAIVKAVYVLCELLPESEKFGLSNQIKRCSVSIPSNIAEGFGRGTSKNFSNFLSIARGSLAELETQIILTKELGYIKTEELAYIEELITEEGKMLNSLINKVKSTSN